MNDLQIYIYSGEQLRTIQRDDGLWWALRDVCGVLGIANCRNVAARLDDDEKEVCQMDTFGGPPEIHRHQRARPVRGHPAVGQARSQRLPALGHARGSAQYPPQRGVWCAPERLERLNKLQAQLTEWRSWPMALSVTPQTRASGYAAARKNYDDLRANRDKCRTAVKQYERYVADEIALLTAE